MKWTVKLHYVFQVFIYLYGASVSTLWQQFSGFRHNLKQQRTTHCYSREGDLGICLRSEDCLHRRKIYGHCSELNGFLCCGLYDVYDETGVKYECGKTSKRFARRGKIVNGSVAQYAEFPWQAYVSATISSRSFCGGALLNNKWVITAAHCVYRYNVKSILVILGVLDFSAKEEPFPQAERRVKRKILHGNFNSKGEYDVALLELTNKVNYQPNIIPICLPHPNTDFTGLEGIVTGWGRTNWNAPPSPILLKVSLPILSDEECSANLNYYHPSFLCSGDINGGRDSCSGDSGGPLQVQAHNMKFYLAGILSSGGTMCAEKGVIGVYTKITLAIPWIKMWTGIETS